MNTGIYAGLFLILCGMLLDIGQFAACIICMLRHKSIPSSSGLVGFLLVLSGLINLKLELKSFSWWFFILLVLGYLIFHIVIVFLLPGFIRNRRCENMDKTKEAKYQDE